MDHLARARKLVALLCVPGVFRLLPVFDVESVLAAASAAVSPCALPACGACRLGGVRVGVFTQLDSEVGDHVGRCCW